MKIEEDVKLDFNDVLIRPKRSKMSSRSQVNIERTFNFPNSKQTWTGVPIIAANMDTVGTYEVYKELSKYHILTALHKFYSLDDYINMMQTKSGLDKEYFMVSTGINDADYDRLRQILDNIEVKFICIDVANGYMAKLCEFCKKVRNEYPDKVIVAGNVVTREITEDLILRGGVDIVKIGIGPGSACTTRTQTGVGMPQLSAILECADAAHGLGAHIIADGGCTCPGDVAKGFGGGADFVMLGGMLAGHDEGNGKIVKINGSKFLLCSV